MYFEECYDMDEVVKVMYEIEFCKQILLSGSGDWDDDDCEWEWESDYSDRYNTREEAEKVFSGLELKDPYCLIFLNEIGLDRYGKVYYREHRDEDEIS